MKKMLFIAIVLLLAGCKVRKSEEVLESIISVDSLLARIEHKIVLSRSTSDSLYRVIERYDTTGRLSEREIITQARKVREQAVEEKQEEQRRVAQQRVQVVRKLKQEQKPASLLSPSWWMLIVVGIVVGVWVSIRYFRVKL